MEQAIYINCCFDTVLWNITFGLITFYVSSDRPDKPYFENCPDELVILPLPLPKAEINLPVELIAWDQDHNKLPIKCNYPIKGNTIGLRQEDLIENTNLQIIAEAEDKWGQRVICDFIVMVQGW